MPLSLGQHLRKRRLNRAQTQHEVAAHFGISFTAYNRWEAESRDESIRSSAILALGKFCQEAIFDQWPKYFVRLHRGMRQPKHRPYQHIL